MIALGSLDLRSIAYAIGGACGFFVLGIICLSLSRFDQVLASVWVPNACAVALLLRARLTNEAPLYAGIALASMAISISSGIAPHIAAIFTVANLVGIALVTWMTRRSCGPQPEMTNLADLGRFLQYGGLLGPVTSASIAATAMGPSPDAIWNGAILWFLADSMGMVLVVPAVLLTLDAIRDPRRWSLAELGERAVMMLAGLAAVFMVFEQDIYPLLFLVPPVTLMMAFRLGGLGTAIYVPIVAAVASVMTHEGTGPIFHAATSDIGKVYLIQAFVAANFLTGLPIAAILAGRDRLTDELAAGRSELALLANTITDAVLRIDAQGVCTYASPSVRDVLGREPGDFVGHKITERTHEDARDQIEDAVSKLLGGASEKERITYRRLLDHADGTPVFIEADCAIAFDPHSGEREGIVVSARDVTERVELELLLTRARRHAENAARAKTEFLANMSHEIRTPMNGVLGFAELMLQGDLDPEQQRHTRMIVQSGRSMMLLLNDILDLSKIEAGQISIDRTPVDLHETVADCTALHRPSAEQKGLQLEFTCDFQEAAGRLSLGSGDRETTHPFVLTDALRVRQIVLNLIGNAVKFTHRGRIDVSCRAEADTFSIEVRDTGIGISASRLEAIFAPFTQGNGDTARRFGGTGLGLTISRQLAELLGGVIEVESTPGEGSVFRLTLPATYAEPDGFTEEAEQPIGPLDLPHDARVLLVEDHDVNRMLCSEMLERCGQTVAIAHDGHEAIAMVMDSVMRAAPYDLVLMDIQMPGCDGYAATRVIRAEGIGPETMPIIALTANAFPEDIAAARNAGMQGHLSKPLVFADLARTLQRWLPTRIVEHDGDCTAHPDQPGEDGWRDQGTGQDRPDIVGSGDVLSLPTPRRRATDGEGAPARMQSHSPAVIHRWTQRRSEAVERVRVMLAGGTLGDAKNGQDQREGLAMLVHKLAGTAAMFGEAELGDQAAALERALRLGLPGDVCEALAFELLSVADDPADLLLPGQA